MIFCFAATRMCLKLQSTEGKRKEPRYTYINPGSVSIPKEESHHGYIILEDDEMKWKDLLGKVIDNYLLR